uniref:GUN4-like domain-containing protein n=1 Tax=Erythroglossum lusitanicum TaxID=2575615 RepID=A0A4D6WSU7_9FLOR|nr:hypothetical protein [Erythroglossum lusitanicum]
MTEKQNNYTNLNIHDKIKQLFYKNENFISNEIINTIDIFLKKGFKEQEELLNILIKRQIIDNKDITLLDGFIFKKLIETHTERIHKKISKIFPNGIIKLKSSLKIDYQPLQLLLIKNEFKEANQLTHKYLCILTNLDNINKRNWLYFTDISSLPSDDLFTIDLLWRIYSYGKFGFSIQRQIWILNNYSWDKLWYKIGWIKEGKMRRYPEEFNWTLNAPKGHLPLINQLRGQQVISSLFKHIVWKDIT